MTEIYVLSITGNASFDYFFTYIIALMPVAVPALLINRLLSRS